jgi:hypothetical protein
VLVKIRLIGAKESSIMDTRYSLTGEARI